MFEKSLSIFDGEEGSPITLFPYGVAFTDLVVDCLCGHPRSDINVLPRDLCPVCGSHMVIVKAKADIK